MNSPVSYIFSLKYSPDFEKYNIHGLWPQPEGKEPLEKKEYDLHHLLDTKDEILKNLPLVWNSDHHKKVTNLNLETEHRDPVLRAANLKFWTGEWEKHGKASPWECEDYFKIAISLYYKLKPELPKLNMHHQVRINLDQKLQQIGQQETIVL